MDPASNGGADAELERIFNEATADMQAGRPAEAAEKLEAVAARNPRAPSVWWNLGILRAQMQQHDRALAAWEAYRELQPDDWRARAKVIQSCQALGDAERRDRERAELLALHRSGAHPELTAQPRFCREQFRVGDRAVAANETFEPSGQRRVFYEFFVGDPGGAMAGVFSLGSYDTTTEVMRELGSIGADDRLYHLDWNDPRGHATHGFFQALPSYEETRAAVVAALAAGAGPIGAAPAGGGPPREAATAAARPGPGARTPPRPSPAPADATRVASGGKRGAGKGTGGPLAALTAWLGRLFRGGGRKS